MDKFTTFPENLEKFMNNTKNKINSNCHNVYLLQSVDREGNVTEEKYGINVLTNLGMNSIFCNNFDGSYLPNNSQNVYIGKGAGVPSQTDTTLFDPIQLNTNVYNATEVDRTRLFAPVRYDSETGMIIGGLRIGEVYIDYNTPLLTNDVNITEIGFGYTINNLYSHALVFDNEGNPSYIIKRCNQRLYITIYVNICINETVIQNAYDNNQYLLINPSMLYFMNTKDTNYANGRGRFYSGYATANKHNASGGKVGTYTVFLKQPNPENPDDFIYYLNIQSPSLLIEDPKINIATTFICTMVDKDNFADSRNISGRWEADAQTSKFLILTEDDKLTDPEILEGYNVYTDSCVNSTFNLSFGNYKPDGYAGVGTFPCTDFTVTSILTYNHQTHDYDISETFEQTEEICVNNLMIYSLDYYHQFNGAAELHSVYVNSHTEFPITSFENTGVVIYAADKYWDESTYQLIGDLSNISTELGTKRYYIKTFDSSGTNYDLRPVRSASTIRMTNTDPILLPAVSTTSIRTDQINRDQVFSNDDDGWVLIGKTLIYPESVGMVNYDISIPGDTLDFNCLPFNYITSAADKIVSLGSITGEGNYDRTIRIYTVTSDSSTAPAYSDVLLNFSASVTEINSLYMKISNDRWLIIYNKNTLETIFVDLDDPTFPQQVIPNSVNGIPMLCTNYLVYRENVTEDFVIHDMAYNTELQRFHIPTDNAYVVYGHVAWKGLVYIRVINNSITSTFVYDMYSDIFTNINADIFALEGLMVSNFPFIEGNDECFIVGFRWKNNYYTEISNNLQTLLFTEEQHTQPILLAYNHTYSLFMKNCNYNKQLVAVMRTIGICSNKTNPSGYSIAIDLGRIIDEGRFKELENCLNNADPQTAFQINHFPVNNAAVGLYKDYVVLSNIDHLTNRLIPIQLWLDHKVIGTTRSIQVFNNPKYITGKQFQIRISNTRTTDLLP